MSAIYIEVLKTRGSVPRGAGTVMRVTGAGIEGTIGGGALEHQAIATALELLEAGTKDTVQTIPLGPSLGQCCGGSVTLRFTQTPLEIEQQQPHIHARAPSGTMVQDLWVWGAGHVGRAVVAQAAPTHAFDITWIDRDHMRFPDDIPDNVTVTPTPEMPLLAAHAPKEALHLILTYSHDIDLALCAALLRRGFGFCGLIGSATKWTRFQKRLRDAGLDPSAITCPIGDPSLGKRPDQIAAGTIRGLRTAVLQKENA